MSSTSFSFKWNWRRYSSRSMSGFARKILVAQLSMMTSRMSERLSSSSDCVDRDHCGVVFPPGLERFDHVSLDGGVLQEHPGLVDEEGFENGTDLAVRDDGIRAMQDVEEQWFQKFRVLAHALEVEALEAGKGNRVFGVVEKESELSAASPFGEPVRNVAPERVRQHAERAEGGSTA